MRRLAALFLTTTLLGAAACGRYGPPVREPARARTPAAEASPSPTQPPAAEPRERDPERAP